MSLLLPVFLSSLLFPLSAEAARSLNSNDVHTYQQAFQLMTQKQAGEALELGKHAYDPVLNEVLMGLYLGQNESNQGYAVYTNFLNSHPNWPGSVLKPIARQAEQHMEARLAPDQALAFFSRFTAQSDEGFRRYIAALIAQGRAREAHQAIRIHWREDGMGEKEQEAFRHSFGEHLTATDTFARLDNMLWDNQDEQVKQLMPLLSVGQKKLAKARMALANGSRNAPKLLSSVPGALQSDRGLMFERIKWRFKEKDVLGALALLEHVGEPALHKEAWWNLRNRAVRELLQTGQYQRAYAQAQNHGLMEGNAFAEAEFLSGWIALRFLHKPQEAFVHFERLYGETSSPITLARAAYWAGRAKEDLSDEPAAHDWYGRALVYGTSYYGQLSAERLYHDSRISVPAPALSEDAKERFENSAEATRIAQLEQIGQPVLAQNFALAFGRSFTQEADFRLLCTFALELGHGEIAVRAAKEAAKKHILLPGEGYPLLTAASNMPPEQAALVHALIRQESEFDPFAVSPSGAVGLMQMLPSTAKHVAHQNNFGEDKPNLFDTPTSLKYGSAYVSELENDFGNYLPLVIAAYNAGPASVHGWMTQMGDPRAGQVDIVDWIESIPFAETRNYVQRVLEGLQIYRARLSGGSTMLALSNDLRGH